MTNNRPIELEAQLSYATALLAACLYLFYELFTFTKETGWEGIFQLMIAIMAMVGLQLVVLGMGLHIYFRGHWMAQAMVEQWKSKRVPAEPEDEKEETSKVPAEEGPEKSRPRWYVWLSELFSKELIVSRDEERRTIDEVESLEVLCIASFYKTFQYLHAYLFTIVLFITLYGAVFFDGWQGTICLVLLIYLASVRVLNILGNTLFFLPIIKRTAKKWEELNIKFQRCFGLWTLPPEFHRRRLDRLHRVAITFLMLALSVLNFLLVWQPTIKADKEVFIRSHDKFIMLKFSHGGVQTNYYAETKFLCRLSTLKPSVGQPKWYPIGGNRYATVIKLSDLHSGVCEARLIFKGYTMKDAGGSKSATVMNVETKFLVID